MAKKRLAALLTAVLLFGCIQFPTQYERIESDRVRLLDFIYDPPEAAPGDTVTVRAVFAGRALSPEDLSWKVSWKVVKNIYGTDTSFDEQELPATIEQGTFSEKTGCVNVRFVIPDNCIAESPMVPQEWTSLLPGELKGEIPGEIASLSKTEVLSMVDSLARFVEQADEAGLAAAEALMPEQVARLSMMVQLLTVPVRLFADIRKDHRIQSDYTVSYSSKFASWPATGVYANTNPRIDSVGVYKVEGANLMRFNPEGANTEFIPLSITGRDTARIPVDKGYSYFLRVFTGRRDTVYTLGDMMQGNSPSRIEEHSAEWLFQMEDDETEDLVPDDLMNATVLGDFDGLLLPPRKRRVINFTLWVQVTDSKLGVLNRSQGSALAEMHGVFDYTGAYLDQFKK